MTEWTFFLRGLLIGFAIAAPVGPIGLLCIQTTLAQGRTAGLVSGLGAATADAVYGSVAAFGMTLVSHALIAEHQWIQAIGGLFLCYLGLRIFRSSPVQKAARLRSGHLWWQYFSIVLLTLTNPTTILSFVAVFAALGIAASADTALPAAFIVLGVFSGSALWWLTLSSGVSMVKRSLTPLVLLSIGRVAGISIAAFGLTALATSGLL